MQSALKLFIAHVREEASKPSFVHHKWYLKYHIEIVEQIATELCTVYTSADRELVQTLVWLHDYGKILGFENDHEMTLLKGHEKLAELGFKKAWIDIAIKAAEVIDRKDPQELAKAAIEIQIVSSADGAAHHTGPFFGIYWYENPDMRIEDIMQSNIKKSLKDWDRKIVLPEVRVAFKQRRQFILEENGELPRSYLK